MGGRVRLLGVRAVENSPRPAIGSFPSRARVRHVPLPALVSEPGAPAGMEPLLLSCPLRSSGLKDRLPSPGAISSTSRVYLSCPLPSTSPHPLRQVGLPSRLEALLPGPRGFSNQQQTRLGHCDAWKPPHRLPST